jgi:hypothetical protein
MPILQGGRVFYVCWSTIFGIMAKGFSGIVRSTVSIFCIGYGFYIIAGIIVNCRANEIDTGD